MRGGGPPPVTHAEFDLNAAGEQLIARRIVLLGWSIRNKSASATAEIDIYDATGVGVVPAFPVTLAANESSREWFGACGILIRSGLYLNVTAGEVLGSVFFDPE